ncbi:MAG: hypothetical protein QM617_15920 [Comamonas sp.]
MNASDIHAIQRFLFIVIIIVTDPRGCQKFARSSPAIAVPELAVLARTVHGR